MSVQAEVAMAFQEQESMTMLVDKLLKALEGDVPHDISPGFPQVTIKKWPTLESRMIQCPARLAVYPCLYILHMDWRTLKAVIDRTLMIILGGKGRKNDQKQRWELSHPNAYSHAAMRFTFFDITNPFQQVLHATQKCGDMLTILDRPQEAVDLTKKMLPRIEAKHPSP